MTGPIDCTDLRAITDDARLLDGLARGDRTDDPTVALLASLRDEAERPPVAPLPGPAPAGDGVTRRPVRRAHWRAAAVLALTALVPSTGVAAAAAHPGSPFYGIHRALLGPTADDPTVPARLLDRAEHEVRAAVVEDRPHAASHVAAAWDLVDRARGHLPHLHASDASVLADRADRVARHLGAVSRISVAEDPAGHIACPRTFGAGLPVVSRPRTTRTALVATITRTGRTTPAALRFTRHHRHHHWHPAGLRPALHELDDAACT